ncbi:serine protease snake-like [Bombus bifarius]|uniref:Serine protease snake-like n=1 Tax=Bombus bifarius TaxID=103933 RepID=A0A6P8MKM2_9HYME|nr:serine protease snake-like [Bombus bifarius]
MRLSARTSIIFFSVLLCCSISCNAQYEGDSCTIDGTPGICVVLSPANCPSVYQDLLKGKPPSSLCGYKNFHPVVCCPKNTPTTTSPNTITSTIKNTTPTTTDRGSVVTKGAKAKAMCEKYAKSVYQLVPSPTLTIDNPLINISVCAIKTRKLIVGGTKAEPKEFPHMAAIGFDTDDGIDWQCGGTLISERFVLTAAHCTYSMYGGRARWVRLGDLNLERTDDDARPQNYLIIERIKHNKYQSRFAYHDIALLKLEKDVEFNAWIRPSCLPYSLPDIGTDGKATASGWGRVDFLEDPSKDLLKVTINLIAQPVCNRSFVYESKFIRGIVDEWQICAGEVGKDTCQGDSGGPLVIFNNDYDCMYSVIGITSIGKPCGLSDPGIYTRVYHYISWIESKVWPDS